MTDRGERDPAGPGTEWPGNVSRIWPGEPRRTARHDGEGEHATGDARADEEYAAAGELRWISVLAGV
ncbi:hypothetical protein [Phytoactinopolyspora halophila]|uniref:hypothetical protein n=1 Tax=Phytoactinopolyspora halophila TaxID=1981511 RepID=UPI000F4E41AD|nr:hypothetical protein [Phytoactinopolyspora halophila]